MEKIYFIDTNVLLDDPNSIVNLCENNTNKVFIPYSVILELDRLKLNTNKNHLVSQVIDSLLNPTIENIFIHKRNDFIYSKDNCSDESILLDIQAYIKHNTKEHIIFVSNDKILRLRVRIELGIETQEYKNSKPFLSDAEIYTGVTNNPEELTRNCFFWRDGKLYWEKGNKLIDYENTVWKVSPRTPYQNMLMELLLDESLDVVSIQSAAGYGKSFLTLAAALQLIFQKHQETQGNQEELPPEQPKKRGRKKKSQSSSTSNSPELIGHKKLFIIRPTVSIGEELGFLPGDLSEKIDPYFRPIRDLLHKLHKIRPCNRLFIDGDPKKGFDSEYIEFMPVNFLRGMNIENAIVIIDECTNLTRLEMRTLLSRMGEGVRCFLTGDTNQVDHPHLNSSNNGLNWVLRKFKGQPNYAHITLKGSKSRGPIADLVIKTEL